MSLTGRVVASIYNRNGYDLAAAGVDGITENFPSQLTQFRAAKAGTTANGITMNSVIEILPTGLNVNPTIYLTDSTVTQLNTNGS